MDATAILATSKTIMTLTVFVFRNSKIE
jgi:hypothetical protein